MNDATFSHLVQIDEPNRMLKIYRVFSGGELQFYTQTPLPFLTSENEAEYQEFVRLLGENIILDSPAARKALGI